MDEISPDDRALIAAFWSAVADHGWAGASMGRFAAAAGQPVATLRDRFPDRLAVLRLHLAITDDTMRRTVSAGAEETVQDRLHDVLMCRVEALQPHRAGILRFAEELRRDPLLALSLAPDVMRSMAAVLDAAGIESGGLLGPVRLKGMLAIWLGVLRAWRDDEGADLGHTMAETDKLLTRAGAWAQRFGLGARAG